MALAGDFFEGAGPHAGCEGFVRTIFLGRRRVIGNEERVHGFFEAYPLAQSQCYF